ncbi:hypothetical protein RJT34_16297 [Clitoria ternatea]|uniref:Uncharacterized protein n=1 Tax=Clitoria ternatea TaxID=43366 RepID=A0AAN9PDJ0_CLITE
MFYWLVENTDIKLVDWNNRRQFTPPSDFHVDEVIDFFISEAVIENTRANEILKHAAFLIPFTSSVKIFISQLAAARQRHEASSCCCSSATALPYPATTWDKL